MSRTVKILLAGGVAFLMLFSLATAGIVAGVASAQTGLSTQSGTDLNQTFWQSLATRLGVTVDKLQQAWKDASKDTVAQGLKDGQLTQQQADEANGRIDQLQPGPNMPAPMPFGKGFGGRGFGHGGFAMLGGQAVFDAAAKTLGMTSADLTTELQSGKTLADVAKEKNVDVNTLKTAMIDAAKAEIDQAVASGKITQAQADQMKQAIDNMAANLDLTRPFFRHGRDGDFHGGQWGPGQAPGSPGTPTTPAGSGA